MSRTKGSLRAAKGHGRESAAGRGRTGPLQDFGIGWTRIRVVPSAFVQIDWFLTKNTMTTKDNSKLLCPARTETCEGPAIANRIVYQVGNISFGVTSSDNLRLALDPSLLEFASASQECDVEISAEWAANVKLPLERPAFESGGLWSAFDEEGGTAFYFCSAYLGEAPYKRAWFNHEYTRGRVQLLKRYFDPDLPVYPLEYPLDELLMIHRLARGEGAEIHACGLVSADGKGRLFVGHSGAGKSTTSRLWLRQPGARVLSDDRIILRIRNEEPVMYGTPWHGDAGLAAQASAPVHQIFLLEHGGGNEIVPLGPSRGAAELFARTFVPYHSSSGLAHTLAFLEKLTAHVPVAVFRFKPDASAIKEILRAA